LAVIKLKLKEFAIIILCIIVSSIIGISNQYVSAENVSFEISTTYEPITYNNTFTLGASSNTTTANINETTPQELEGQTIPNQYIVLLKEDEITNTTTGLESVLQSLLTEVENLGADVPYVYKYASMGFAIKASNNQTLTEALNIIRMNPHVEFILQDQYIPFRSQRLPTGIDRVDGEQQLLSPTTIGNRERIVDADIAVIDSGIDLDHSDLNVYRNINLLSPSNPGDDDSGHGTLVAGVAAAKDNQEGVVGIAPGARLWAIKACDRLGCSTSALLSAIDYATNNKEEIDVVNISVGCTKEDPALSDYCPPVVFDPLQNAIGNSAQQGVAYAVAAGNDGVDARNDWPASNPNVIAISAVQDYDGKCGGLAPDVNGVRGNDDKFAPFSNFGPDIDVAAPGVNIYSTIPNNSYFPSSGTSMAAPHVAGAIALYKENHPSASLSEIRDVLINTGSKPDTPCVGDGRGYFTGDPDNIPEPLLYVKSIASIDSFDIFVRSGLPRFSENDLYLQGYYKCEPPIITFDGFLEGEITSSRTPEFSRPLSNIMISANRDIGSDNTVIRIIADNGKIGAVLKFQGSIDCSKPALISTVRGQNCMWVSDLPQDTCNPNQFLTRGSLTLH
jgi:subtilisin